MKEALRDDRKGGILRSRFLEGCHTTRERDIPTNGCGGDHPKVANVGLMIGIYHCFLLSTIKS